MRKHLSTIVLVFLLLIGLSLLLYPTVSDYWNSFHQTRAIATYAENVAALDNASYDAIWETPPGSITGTCVVAATASSSPRSRRPNTKACWTYPVRGSWAISRFPKLT